MLEALFRRCKQYQQKLFEILSLSKDILLIAQYDILIADGSNNIMLCREDAGWFTRILRRLASSWNLVYARNSSKSTFWTFSS